SEEGTPNCKRVVILFAVALENYLKQVKSPFLKPLRL
ncbi:hypothetical protein LINPERHAP2_LOCUS40971, partial [Linum perenne]